MGRRFLYHLSDFRFQPWPESIAITAFLAFYSWLSNKRTGVDSDMDTLMEFSIQGDIFFFYDTLSDEEKETVRKCMREKYKGHIVANPKIDEFLEGLERDHGIKLKRLSVTSVIAV